MSDSDGPSGQKSTVSDTWKLQVTPDAKPLISQSTKDLISKWANAYNTQYSDAPHPDMADKYLVPVVHSVGPSSVQKYVDGQENRHPESGQLYLQYPPSALGQVSCGFTNLNYAYSRLCKVFVLLFLVQTCNNCPRDPSPVRLLMKIVSCLSCRAIPL